MNRLHHWLCRSDSWRKTAGQRVSWALAGADLGNDVLELGPGYGLTTDLLRVRARHLTALEIDPELAESLRARTAGTNIEVVTGDATAMPFPDGRFSAVVSFTMLHHVHSPGLQDRVLREALRVLAPGGMFAGADSRQSLRMRILHIGDTLVPVDPDRFAERLASTGFAEPSVEKSARAFRFHARRSVYNQSLTT